MANVVFPDDLADDSVEYREGRKKTVQVNLYERNPVVRQACIDHYGTTCCVCGFDFGKKYGKKCNGMIHVHHLNMVSTNDEEQLIHPVNDLRPVCPNCHMVLHSKKEGCYTLDEVVKMLNSGAE